MASKKSSCCWQERSRHALRELVWQLRASQNRSRLPSQHTAIVKYNADRFVRRGSSCGILLSKEWIRSSGCVCRQWGRKKQDWIEPIQSLKSLWMFCRSWVNSVHRKSVLDWNPVVVLARLNGGFWMIVLRREVWPTLIWNWLARSPNGKDHWKILGNETTHSIQIWFWHKERKK